jgi:hypothetical protein
VDLGSIFGAFWQMGCISKTIEKLFVFKGFLEVLAWLNGMVEPSWGLFWAKLAARWRFLVDVGAMLRHVARKMPIKSVKLRQLRRKQDPAMSATGSDWRNEGEVGVLEGIELPN